MSYEQKIRIRRNHAVAVLNNLATAFERYSHINNHVLERAHLQAAARGAEALGRMILANKVKDEDVEFLTWLPMPPPVVPTVKEPGKKKAKTYASDYRSERLTYADQPSDDDPG
jgi:hypothetical protein